MFALMKFQQQTNAAAFSHAFVLTVKICSSSEELFNLKYPIVKEVDVDATFKDANNSLKFEERAVGTVINTADETSLSKSTICRDKEAGKIPEEDVIEDSSNGIISGAPVDFSHQDNIIVSEPTNFHEGLDARIKSPTMCTRAEKDSFEVNDVEFRDNICTDKSVNCNGKRLKRNTVQHFIMDHKREQSLLTTKKKGKVKNDIDEEEIKGPSSDRTCLGENSTEKEENVPATDNENSLDRSTTTIDGKNIIKSNNVQYHCFIEKEIKNIKDGTRSGAAYLSTTDKSMQNDLQQYSTSKIKSANKDFKLIEEERVNESVRCNEMSDLKLQERDKKHDNSQTRSNTCNKSYKTRKQKSRESERKTIADDKILRSSNITDLVMEGLMFTIRQDEDSVAVIEQKTKLEVDEVLENSEKVETKAGEKCLLNSSLLRLEDLITKIDPPRDKNERCKTGRASSNSTYTSPIKLLDGDSAYNNLYDINCINRITNKSSVLSYDKHKVTDPYESLWQRREAYSSKGENCTTSGNIMEKKNSIDQRSTRIHQNDTEIERGKVEEEEDVVSEVFRSAKLLHKRKNVEPQDKDLSMDNMDIEETEIRDTPVKEERGDSPLSHFSLSSNKTSSEYICAISRESRSTKRQRNVPRVISDKLITAEQVPLPLRKILRDTCKIRSRSFSQTSTGGTLSTREHRKTQQRATLAETVTSETNASSVERCADPDRATIEITVGETTEETRNNNDQSRITFNSDAPRVTNEDDACASNVKGRSSEINRASSSSRHGSPRKLQDITEDFYYDLHTYNRESSVRQRRLRQRRKFNNPGDIRNCRTRIEMFKFIQDMTEGVKVVVKRLNIEKKSSLLEKNSALATSTH